MNASVSPADDAHLLRCWRIQNCKDCLKQVDCSWCPFSWTCVPNSNRVQLLAPAWDENVCPHWAERWEIRTRPLGCQVSTITTLTSFVTIASTLVFALLVTLTVFGIQRLRAYSDKSPGLWKAWANAWKDWWAKWQQQRYPMIHGNEDDVEAREQGGNEREPLLPS